jgi:asparagine synthase (glutamine-hydrolysing)
MCGISGLWNINGAPVAHAVLEDMNSLLAHRGPDGSGTYQDGALGLGHTRLAILDTGPGGHQPMSYGEGRWWLTFNGEIYNFLELRETLTGLGHRFESESDSEVLLAAFAEWGPECQRRFNGMWAFALWDSQEGELFLSRDRFGVKPLFWYFDGRRFAFASEMKAFLALPDFSAQFDDRAVATAIMHVIPFEGTERGLLEGVKRLPPGHCMTVRSGQAPKLRRWWRTLDHLPDPPLSLDRQIERFRELLFDACKIRMRSDVPLATCLSGGLDSSAIHGVIARLNGEGAETARRPDDWQTAFFLGDDDGEERGCAEDVVAFAGTRGVYKNAHADGALQHLDEIIFNLEEIGHLPVGQWLLYRELRQHGIVVSLDGHGADELAAGYRHFPNHAMIEAVEQLRNLKEASHAMGVEGIDNKLAPLLEALPEFAPFDPTPKPTPIMEVLRAAPYPFEFPLWAEDGPDLADRDRLTRHIYFETHEGRMPWILREFDRASMANGVESRAPFLDWCLMVYAFALPIESKIRGGSAKYVLREALKGILPENVRTRRKKLGFPIEIYNWLAGPLKDFALDTINSEAFLQSPIWDGPRVRNMAERALVEENRRGIKIAWPFIHAALLSGLFSKQQQK